MFSRLSSTLLKQGLQELINSWDTLEGELRSPTVFESGFLKLFLKYILKDLHLL